jgi:CRP-like cAMP-binding protein
MKEEALRRLLKGQLLLATATEEELTRVVEWARIDRLKSGQPVAFAGDANSALHMLFQGELRSFVVSVDGHEIPLRTYSSGQAFDAATIIQRAPLPFNVVALVDSTVAALSRAYAHTLLRSPTIAPSVNELMSDELLQYARRFGGTASPRAKARVAAFIASGVSEKVEYEWPVVEIPDQATLAALAQVSRETVSRVLKSLETEEVIVRMGRRLRIRNIARLQRIAAGFEPD